MSLGDSDRNLTPWAVAIIAIGVVHSGIRTARWQDLERSKDLIQPRGHSDGVVRFKIRNIITGPEVAQFTRDGTQAPGWSVLELAPEGEKQSHLLLGLGPEEVEGDFILRKGWVMALGRELGAKVLQLAANGLSSEIPNALSANDLRPMNLSLLALGMNIRKAPGGGFENFPGTWSVYQMLVPTRGKPARAFLNVDLKYEWLELVADGQSNDAGLMEFLAMALRDGPGELATSRTEATRYSGGASSETTSSSL